jgi:hypothetical protein
MINLGSVYPDPDNITRFYQLFQYANTVSGNAFGWLIAMAIFVIMFMSFKAYFSTARSLATAGFISTILAILLFTLSILSLKYIFIFCAITALGFVMIWFED